MEIKIEQIIFLKRILKQTIIIYSDRGRSNVFYKNLKTIFREILLVYFLFFNYLISSGQSNIKIDQISVNNGLSQGLILDIIQSRDGFIWIGTKDGLNRYDGIRFEVYTPDPFNPFAISDSEIRLLFEDSRGLIWVVFQDGMDVLDPIRGLFFHVNHKGENIYYDHINSIVETVDGSIWFSDQYRLWKINIHNDLLSKAIEQGEAHIEPNFMLIPIENVNSESDEKLVVHSLFLSQGKKLLLCSSQGLLHFDPVSQKSYPELPLAGFSIYRMAENKDGDWLFQGSRFNGKPVWIWKTADKVSYREDQLTGIESPDFVFDDTGCFWTNRDKIIQKWKPSEFIANGIPDLEFPYHQNNFAFAFNDFLKDKSNLIWIGTSGYGILKINEKGNKFKTVLPGTAHRMLKEDPQGYLYISGVPEKKFLSTAFDQSLPNNDVSIASDNKYEDFAFDTAGNIWQLNKSKSIVFRKDALTKKVKSYPCKGIALLFDRNGKLLIVNEKGLERFDCDKEMSDYFPFDKPQKQLSENSHFMYEDHDGIVWIFGFEGLTRATPNQSGYEYKQYLNNPSDRNSLSINTVLSVADDPCEPNRYLWVGTKNGGLNCLDKHTGEFRQFNKGQGLPDNVVYGILTEDKGKPFIWLSTNKGLCRFDVRSKTTKNFTVADGLQANEFNCPSYLKTHNGTMIFGGVNGLTVFHPDSLRFNDHVPLIHIVGFQVNNKNYVISDKSSISLAHDQNLISFEFAALEFTNPEQNQYRYQLVGVDNEWVSLGNKNSVQFANLAPGTYNFKVDGSNNDGTWSSHPAELKFIIRPPWFASFWAYLVYIALGAGAVVLYYRFRFRQRLKLQETLRLKEMDEFKSRFFTNITHEFRTPLTVILGMSEQLVNDVKDQNQIKKIGLIKRNGDNLLRLINQILDLSKLESNTLKLNYIHGDVLAYLKYIVESLHSLANAQNLLLRVESDQVKIEMDYDPERILQITFNLLSNAIKFTPSGGKIILKADLNGSWFHLSISDTGVGIPEDEIPFLFERFFQAKNQEHTKSGGSGIGLSLVSELVKAMGGFINVESKIGVGSKFSIRLPVTNKVNKDSSIVIQTLDLNKVLHPNLELANKNINDSDNDSDKSLFSQILLIEDNPDVVEYLTACLQIKFQLDFAFNGQAGIDKALETIPDIIISDVMMPIKDGFDVLEKLKVDEKTSHIPIILLTAKADIQSRLTGLRKGADAYLSKPFHQEELIVTVENLLASRRLLQAKFQQNNWLKSEVKEIISEDIEDVFIQKFRAVVEKNLSDTDFEMPQLERALSMSRSQIYRKIKALTDKSPSLLIRSIRLHHGKNLLLTTQLSVSEIAYQVGYSAVNNFSDAYLEEFGERPMKTRG